MKIIKVFTILLLTTTLYLGWFFHEVTSEKDISSVTVNISTGSTLDQIAQELENKGVIDNKNIFKKYVKLRGYQTKLKAGTYSFLGEVSVRSVVNDLLSGSVDQLTITILEGWNLRDIAQELIELGIIKTPQDLYVLTGEPGELDNTSYTPLVSQYDFFKVLPQGLSLEGFIFPDTYHLFVGATAEDFLKKAFDNFQKKITNLNIKQEDLFQVITEASIIAKEGRTFEDKRMIAGVFKNRLNIGMALQSDPTVNYITQKITDNPSLKDIDINSPYNTYKYPGLPPGPISNPGLDDLRAALDPIDHDYFYFLNTQDGEMIFSKTFAEHKANRFKYGQ